MLSVSSVSGFLSYLPRCERERLLSDPSHTEVVGTKVVSATLVLVTYKLKYLSLTVRLVYLHLTYYLGLFTKLLIASR